jgi:hypothetical protein
MEESLCLVQGNNVDASPGSGKGYRVGFHRLLKRESVRQVVKRRVPSAGLQAGVCPSRPLMSFPIPFYKQTGPLST